MQFIPSGLDGCYELIPSVQHDDRGIFVKTFQHSLFLKAGLRSDFVEEYYSFSNCNVVRGMHFQTPPYEHAKLVYCAQGKAFDVAVDLRVGSPTFKKVATFILDGHKSNAVYLPPGFAHGFCALADQTLLVYKVTSEYQPSHDTGILWESVHVNWPVNKPTVSLRDQGFMGLDEYVSPFCI